MTDISNRYIFMLFNTTIESIVLITNWHPGPLEFKQKSQNKKTDEIELSQKESEKSGPFVNAPSQAILLMHNAKYWNTQKTVTL